MTPELTLRLDSLVVWMESEDLVPLACVQVDRGRSSGKQASSIGSFWRSLFLTSHLMRLDKLSRGSLEGNRHENKSSPV